MSRWPMVALSEIFEPHDHWVQINPDTSYRQVTVRLWGKGLCLRGQVPGSAIAATTQNEVRQGQFLISKIDARHGAFGLVPPDLHGAVVSADFPQRLFDAGNARQTIGHYLAGRLVWLSANRLSSYTAF